MALGLIAAPATATLTETVTVSNNYGYFFDSGTPSTAAGGTRQTIYDNFNDAGYQASLGVDYVGEAAPGSFYFLHNDYCVGICAIRSDTRINFTVTNTGPNLETLRFDSEITPGHLARLGDDPRVSSGFDFSVVLSEPRVVGVTRSLYSAAGSITANGVTLSTDFNGLTRTDTSDGMILDWSATPLDLALGTLPPGQSLTVSYFASYYVNSFGLCNDVEIGCSGSQVAFGDPRNNGGGVGKNGLMLSRLAALDPMRDIINRDYDAYVVPASIVTTDTPLPAPPPSEPTLTYGDDFSTPSVPEPAIWLQMASGLGLMGAIVRRRRRAASLA